MPGVKVRKVVVDLGRNPFSEPRRLPVYENRCPECGRWTALTYEALEGREVFVCPALGCEYKVRGDFRPFVEALARHEAAEAAKRERPA